MANEWEWGGGQPNVCIPNNMIDIAQTNGFFGLLWSPQNSSIFGPQKLKIHYFSFPCYVLAHHRPSVLCLNWIAYIKADYTGDDGIFIAHIAANWGNKPTGNWELLHSRVIRSAQEPTNKLTLFSFVLFHHNHRKMCIFTCYYCRKWWKSQSHR